MRRRLHIRRHGLVALSLLTLAASAVSCTESRGGAPPPAASASKTAGGSQDSPSARPEHPSRPNFPAPATVRADELGAVPVLMYHQIVDRPRSVYDRSPRDFRAELERLAKEKYVPVTAGAYSTGKIGIPAGAHPVVLTFDDSTDSQFRLGKDGKPTADCAIGILLAVAREHPQFKPVATLFVNGGGFPATGTEKSLAWLHRNGFEIGNHTLDHANLRDISAAQAQHQIAADQKVITKSVPGAQVTSMGLPLGVQPNPASLGLKGSADGVTYRHDGAYLVGAGPAPSPYAADFDPVGIPRIRSASEHAQDAQFGSAHWLDQLAHGKVTRYTSDGDPDHISYPKSTTARLAKELRERGRAY
ncbi:polysaccharide deacetylase family protein [Streptomyces piniterrae]|uniref:polysaccharide deacetylase family protein n=1 Tax=Streptomyces piniterrae TaxID=2571125 RepID=UPI001FE842AB|nr:polysaccharide deacetylase family protein [Streptomyces piniterrae]